MDIKTTRKDVIRALTGTAIGGVLISRLGTEGVGAEKPDERCPRCPNGKDSSCGERCNCRQSDKVCVRCRHANNYVYQEKNEICRCTRGKGDPRCVFGQRALPACCLAE